MNYDRDDLPRRLADDYVLGGLRGAARRRFERLQREQRIFREARREAENRWNCLAEALDPIQPSDQVWHNIRARIAPARAGAGADRSWGPALWRAWAVAATLILALWVIAPQFVESPPADTVAVITYDADSTAGWLVSLKAGGSIVRVASLSDHELPGDRVFQLWVKSPEFAQVKPVGLISPSGTVELRAGGDLQIALSSAVLFGVSVEPPGGSPTGQPTTTPLAHGTPKSIGL